MPIQRPRRSFAPPEDNPLQNMKLRQLSKDENPEFVLTFNNLSSKHYQPKKKLTYRQLFGELQQEQTKMRLMLSLAQAQQPKELPQRTPTSRPTSVSKTRRPRQSSGELRPEKDGVSLRRAQSGNLMRNIHSSYSTGRLLKIRTSWTGEYFNQADQDKPRSLRVKGSKAPSQEMVDHLRRNSISSLRRLEYE
jgi:hypothetical protein